MITKKINGGNFEPVVTGEIVLDATPTVNSFNTVTSDGIARAIAGASGEVPVVTENDNGKVLTAVYDAGGPAVEWAEAQGGDSYTAGDGIDISEGEISAKVDGTTIQVNADGELEAIGGGGTSYTAGVGIYIDSSNNEISIDRDDSGGISFNHGSVMLDYPLIAQNSNDTLVETIGDDDAAIGVQVRNPVPDPTGATSGDVLTIGQNGPEWAAPGGGGGASYTAGDGINISDQNVISVPVDNKTLAVERPTYVYSGITNYTDTVYLALGLSDLPTVASTSSISAFKLTPQITSGGLSYTLGYNSETQTGLNVRVQLGSDSSFTKYATSTENAKIGNSPVVLGTTVFNLSDCNAFTPTMGHSSTTFGELFDFVGGDSFDDIFSGSSVYIRLVAWDSANGAVVGAPLTIRTTGYPHMRWAITTNAAAAKMVVKYNTNTLELSHPGNGYLSVKNPNPYPMPEYLGTAGQVLTVNSGATGIEWASPSGVPTQLLTPAQTASMIDTSSLPSSISWYDNVTYNPLASFTRGGGIRRLFIGMFLKSAELFGSVDFTVMAKFSLNGEATTEPLDVIADKNHLTLTNGVYVYICKEIPLFIPETFNGIDGPINVDYVTMDYVRITFDTTGGGTAPTTLLDSSLSVWLI